MSVEFLLLTISILFLGLTMSELIFQSYKELKNKEEK